MATSTNNYLNVIGGPGKIPALDGLRAIAIFLVLLRHGIKAMPPNDFNAPAHALTPLYNLAFNGWLGVDLFFVLSGFLISRHLLQSRYQVNGLKTFYLGRMLRTFPLYYFVLALVFADILPEVELTESLDALTSLKYMLFLQDYFGAAALVPLWSLAVEEKFYLLAPLAVAGLIKLTPKSAALLIFVVAGISPTMRLAGVMSHPPLNYVDFFWAYRAPFHTCLDGMLLGMCVAWLTQYRLVEFSKPAKMRLFYICLFACGGILCFRPWVESQSWMVSNLLIYGFCLLSATAIWCAVHEPALSAGLLGSRLLRLLARISYAAYLIHYLCIPPALTLAGKLGTAYTPPIFWLAYMLLTLICSVGLHLLVEKPFLLIKNQLTNPIENS